MHSRYHRKIRRGGRHAATRRIALLVSSASLVFVALALPTGGNGHGVLVAPAFAAGENNGSGGALPQKKSLFGSEGAADEIADPVTAASGASDAHPAPRTGSKTTQVIKEIAGVSEDTELSSEEELDAIRNGWGTWRTADGPESVIAQ